MEQTDVLERSPAWQRTGVAVTATTAEEAIVEGDLDWTVAKLPLFVKVRGRERAIKNRFATLRMDTKELLGLVGPDYQLWQNREAFTFFDNLVDSGEAKYETVGHFRGGKVVWLAAKIPQDILIGGVDAVHLYLLLVTSHDGTKAISVNVTPVRVDCENTLNIALGAAQRKWRVMHVSTMQGRLIEAREALELTFAYSDAFTEKANALIDKAVTDQQFKRIVERLGVSEKAQSEIQLLWINSPTVKPIRNTAWGALNTVAEYYEWTVPRTDESRIKSTLGGRAFVMRDRVLALL